MSAPNSLTSPSSFDGILIELIMAMWRVCGVFPALVSTGSSFSDTISLLFELGSLTSSPRPTSPPGRAGSMRDRELNWKHQDLLRLRIDRVASNSGQPVKPRDASKLKRTDLNARKLVSRRARSVHRNDFATLPTSDRSLLGVAVPCWAFRRRKPPLYEFQRLYILAFKLVKTSLA